MQGRGKKDAKQVAAAAVLEMLLANVPEQDFLQPGKGKFLRLRVSAPDFIPSSLQNSWIKIALPILLRFLLLLIVSRCPFCTAVCRGANIHDPICRTYEFTVIECHLDKLIVSCKRTPTQFISMVQRERPVRMIAVL